MTSTEFGKALARGHDAISSGNLPDALKHFQAAVNLSPDEPEGYLWTGHILLCLAKYKQALPLLKQGLSRPCGVSLRSFGLRQMGQYFINMRKPRAALNCAQEALRNEPVSPENNRFLGQVLAALKRNKDAEAAFRQAQSLAPDNVRVLLSFARFLKSRRRLAEARQLMEQAGAIEPENIYVMLLRGQIAFALDDLPTARDMALWALSRNAMNRDALGLLALIKSRQTWPAMPFWWLFSALQRAPRFLPLLAGAILGLVFSLVEDILPAQTMLSRADLETAWYELRFALLVYALLCILHVGFLVARDQRRVKLKNF